MNEYQRGRESAARDLEVEAAEYETQLGAAGMSAGGLLREAARLIRERDVTPPAERLAQPA